MLIDCQLSVVLRHLHKFGEDSLLHDQINLCQLKIDFFSTTIIMVFPRIIVCVHCFIKYIAKPCAGKTVQFTHFLFYNVQCKKCLPRVKVKADPTFSIEKPSSIIAFKLYFVGNMWSEFQTSYYYHFLQYHLMHELFPCYKQRYCYR